MNRLPGQAAKPSAQLDVEKGQAATDQKVDQDLPDVDVDTIKFAGTQDAEGKAAKVTDQPGLPELPLKAQP